MKVSLQITLRLFHPSDDRMDQILCKKAHNVLRQKGMSEREIGEVGV
jgi:hypothetical protein